jgi:hypothetical protein
MLFTGISQAKLLKYRDDIHPKHFNHVTKSQESIDIRIYYDKETNSFDFYVEESMYVNGFTLNRAQADVLVSLIDKYKEWNLKASKQGVTLEKEIGKLDTSATFWKIGNGDWSYGLKPTLSFGFLSQSSKTHQLVITFPRFIDGDYRDLVHIPETLYFGYSEAMDLRNSLTERNVSGFLKIREKQALIDAGFK